MFVLDFCIFHLNNRVISTSRDWCKTSLTTLFYITSYNSFAPSPGNPFLKWYHKDFFPVSKSMMFCVIKGLGYNNVVWFQGGIERWCRVGIISSRKKFHHNLFSQDCLKNIYEYKNYFYIIFDNKKATYTNYC